MVINNESKPYHFFFQETVVGHCIQKANTEESESCLGAMSKWKNWEESEGADAKSDQLRDTMGATSYPEWFNDFQEETNANLTKEKYISNPYMHERCSWKIKETYYLRIHC